MQAQSILRICVRLPNWLGDVVMSLGFLHVLRETYPAASITIVIKKGLEQIVSGLDEINSVLVFSKDEYKGLCGVWKFGKSLRTKESFDLFFVLPDSFSAAVMAYASGAGKRIGYRHEGRQILLNHGYLKQEKLHRVDEYVALLYSFNPASQFFKPLVQLKRISDKREEKYIVLNVNSEAVSRRLPIEKAVALIQLLQQYCLPIKLIGSSKEKPYISEVYGRLQNKNDVEVVAGKTNLQQLVVLIQNAVLMVSSDSGPAHIASASEVPLVVLFGAGNEQNTGPYQNNKAIVVRNGKLPCEPCVKNTCKLAPLPVCMMQLDMMKVMVATEKLLNKNDERIF